ncbi:MAG: AMP-binding protein, partial [Deltaproteobacteria bacterium]|nr:AMP-binding protein [Deltaproteobacteria bacterium]
MTEQKTLLEHAYHWEKTTPARVFLTQPVGPGNVKDYTFADVMGQARRMASYLRSLKLEPGSSIAICSKNCAHWIMADLAIWMAGHRSIPVYPILTQEITRHVLEHSEARLLFVGKLDPVWDGQMKDGVPKGLPQIAFPLAPPSASGLDKWDDVVAKQQPLQVAVDRSADEVATIIYTSGSTGVPKGALLTFGAMLGPCEGLQKILSLQPDDRYLSYLPIAHSMERWLGECMALYAGHHIFYA